MKEKRSFFQKITGMNSASEPVYKNKRALPVSEDDEYYDEDEENYEDTPTWAAEEEIPEEDGELSVDLYQTEKDLVIEAMIAGVKPEDIQINITRDTVTIAGKRDANKIVGRDDYFYQELYWGSFSRSILLPHEVDIEGSESIEKHGMLIIKMPKIDKERQSKIKVKSLS
jgi:HSP20 family protein